MTHAIFWAVALTAILVATGTAGLLLLVAYIAKGCPDVNGDPERDAVTPWKPLEAADGTWSRQTPKHIRQVDSTPAASPLSVPDGRVTEPGTDPAGLVTSLHVSR
jgi:hypothetical protein